jgi:hypothetical protein
MVRFISIYDFCCIDHAPKMPAALFLLISLRCAAVDTSRANHRRLTEAITFLIDLLTKLSWAASLSSPVYRNLLPIYYVNLEAKLAISRMQECLALAC